MDYRTGKCSQCGAEYKVPASFAHNAARCKVCKGVVHLGPPQSGAGPKPAASASTPSPAPVAPAARPAPSAMPARKVVPKPTAPAQAAAPTPKPAAPAAAPTPIVKRPTAAAPSARPVVAGAFARRKEMEAEDDAEESPRARGRAAREKKKASPVALLSVVGLVVVGAVLVLFRGAIFGTGEARATDESASASTPPADGAPPAASGATATPAPNAGGASTEVTAAGVNGSLDEAAAREPLAAEAEAEKPKAGKAPKDPSSIDLAAIPDFAPTPDTTPEEWAQMKEWMAQWMDVDAGAAGNRAKLKLEEQKRKAMPVILNHFKTLDFATKEGRSNGDQCQKSMMKICNGNNFDWAYADEAAGRGYDHPDDVWFCKRAAELWCKTFRQVDESIEAWIRMAKLEAKDPAEAERLRQMFGGQTPTDASQGAEGDLEVD
jgi:hypothetical protein